MSAWGHHVPPEQNARTWRAGSDASVPAVLTVTPMVPAVLTPMNVREHLAVATHSVGTKLEPFRVLVHLGLEGTRW